MKPVTLRAGNLAATAATNANTSNTAHSERPLIASRWPGHVAPIAEGLYVIAVPTVAQRESARLQVRQALRELLAQVLERELHTISIDNQRGQAPQIFLDGVPQAFGCSFSYAGHAALAALHLHGAVGVDMMLPSEMPDWQAVAHDYLGPSVAATLAATPPAQRARAFSDAWCALEATLKCHGEALSEWHAARSGAALHAALTIAPLYASLSPAACNLPQVALEASAHLVWQIRLY